MSEKTDLNTNSVERNTNHQLHDMLIYILISFQLLYPIKQLVPSFLQIPIFIFWMFVINFKYLSRLRGMFTIVIFLIIKILLSGNFNMSFFDPINVLIKHFQFIIWYSIFLYVKDINGKRKKKIVVFSMICIFISVIFSLYYVLLVDPQAIRNTQRGFLWGAGDFELMYGLAMFVGCIVCLLLYESKYKYIYLTLFTLCMLTLLKCNLVTALVLAMLSCFVGILLMTRYNKIYVLLCSLVLPVIYLIKDKIAFIFLKLSTLNLFYKTTKMKLVAISNLLIGSGSTDTLSERSMLMMQSIHTFLKNPIIGLHFSDYKQGVIGGHAQWFDDLATFGLIGIIIVSFVLYNCFSLSLKNCDTKLDRNGVKLVWFIYIVLGFLNPNMMGAVYVVMFIIAPFLSSIVSDER